MLKFITNLFTKKHEAPTAPAPYKVETPKTVDTTPKAADVKPVAKKPAVKKATAKPRKPRAPKA